MTLKSINPANGKLIKQYDVLDAQAVNVIIEKAEKDFRQWAEVSFTQRAIMLKRAAFILRERTSELVKLMALEVGKVRRDSEAEIEKCARVCEYYAKNGEAFLADEPISTHAATSYVTFRPMGIVLAVMPWNFPFWQVFRFAAPALMAGNGVLLKHASNVTGCSLVIEEIFGKAGCPENLFRSLPVPSEAVASVIENRHVKAVTLTGSTPAGRSVAALAGQNLKKAVLELGGNDAYLILKDANLNFAAKKCTQSRLINNGQSCIAAKRFIVVKEVKKAFEERMVAEMKKYNFGDPTIEVKLGPMAHIDLRDELHRQVQESINSGATCLLGGQVPEHEGAFYPPTVLTDVKKGSPAYDDELFGPVAAIIEAANEKEAIDIANDSTFGLGAAVFTTSKKRGNRIARESLEAGNCFVNSFVESDPRLPFGGVKESGYGRELGSYGIKEFVNIKTVFVG